MAYIYNFTDTWTNGATTYDGIGLDVTNTASGASSRLINLKVGGTSKFSVDADGTIRNAMDMYLGRLIIGDSFRFGAQNANLTSATSLAWTSGNDPDASNVDLRLYRDAANTLAQRRTTNAQTYRVYNTYTDASNYERFGVNWASNVLTLATEAAGTGTQRNLAITSPNLTVNDGQWTNGATVYDGISLNVTDTASAATSNLIHLKVGGTSKFRVQKNGAIHVPTGLGIIAGGSSLTLSLNGTVDQGIAIGGGSTVFGGACAELRLNGSGSYWWDTTDGQVIIGNETRRVGTAQNAVGILQQSGVAMSLRVYNVSTSTSNYERAKFGWTSNELIVGTEAAGTGTKRNMKLDSANRSVYIASPTAAEIRDILISFGLMAAS